MTRLFIIVVSFLALAGCAVSSEVSRFHRMTPEVRGATFAVVPDAGQFGSAEFAHYAQRTAGHLIGHGFVPAPAGTVARLRVEIAYRAGAGETVTRREPVYVRRYDPFAYHYFRTGIYRSYVPWSWGFAGYETVTETRYPRVYEIRIVDRLAPPERAVLFEGEAVNRGFKPDFGAVGDCLIDAMFLEFPGTSGNRRSIAVSPAQCQ